MSLFSLHEDFFCPERHLGDFARSLSLNVSVEAPRKKRRRYSTDFGYARLIKDLDCKDELVELGVSAELLELFLVDSEEGFYEGVRYGIYKGFSTYKRMKMLLDLRIENRLDSDAIMENAFRRFYGLDCSPAAVSKIAKSICGENYNTEKDEKFSRRIEKALYLLKQREIDDREEMINKLSDRLHRYVDEKIEASEPLDISLVRSYLDHMEEIAALFPTK